MDCRNKIEPEMVTVPGGIFKVQSSITEDSEKSTNLVTINNFKISKHQITVGQFRKFAEATDYITTADQKGGSIIYAEGKSKLQLGINWEYDAFGFKRQTLQDNQPVIHVSWDDAFDYSQWLSSKTGKVYRLPTETEWEYAARVGIKDNEYYELADYNNIGEFARYFHNDGNQSHALVLNQSNDLGIYDMLANIGEWCSDWYEDKYNIKSAEINANGSDHRVSRVIRGGCWDSVPASIRLAYRRRGSPDYTEGFIGFRLALSF